jgi:chemotaxis protein CheZ
MPIRRTVFRIEETHFGGCASNGAGVASASPPPQQHAAPARPADRVFKSETIGPSGLRALKDETDTIHRAISRTKHEIATLHASGFNGMEDGRVFRELDAVVGGTEQATQQILAAAEEIDEAANNLSALIKRGPEQALAQDIRDQVIRIYEACNFQDLAGQRITKVLTTLKFVDDHVTRMIDIWGGVEAFKDAATLTVPHERAAINGPKLDGDPGHASQDEIDALFGAK